MAAVGCASDAEQDLRVVRDDRRRPGCIDGSKTSFVYCRSRIARPILSIVCHDCPEAQNGRQPARGASADVTRRGFEIAGSASDRLAKLQAGVVDLKRRTHQLHDASAQLQARSHELLARAHDNVQRASALRSQRTRQGAASTSDGGNE